jgi:hypothetical protein
VVWFTGVESEESRKKANSRENRAAFIERDKANRAKELSDKLSL